MRLYIVSTHLGDFETMAPSPRKAVSNVRYRIFCRGVSLARIPTKYWTVKEAA